MSDPAPGRYCLAVCYCRQCPHYVPIKRTSDRDDLTPPPPPTPIRRPR